MDEYENISLFGDLSESEQVKTAETPETKSKGKKKHEPVKLSVTKLDFVQGESLTWQELFQGFDTLHAITYSSGIDFVGNLLDLFTQAEIIFGCEAIMSYSLQEIMAFQEKLIDRISLKSGKSKNKILNRVQNGSLRLFAARTALSHEKIYLLSSNEGKKRVVMGSANMSATAFGGIQRENISYIDGEMAYSWYMDCYLQLKAECTDKIPIEALCSKTLEDDTTKLPICGTVRAQKAIVVKEVEESKPEVQFVLDVNRLAEKYEPSVSRYRKNGMFAIVPANIEAICKSIARKAKKEAAAKKVVEQQAPKLEISLEDGIVRLQDKAVNLNPSAAEIRNDVSLFLKYMDGFNPDNFHGDIEGTRTRYYEFANWVFCSPFLAAMRNTALMYNYTILPYPVFGIIYGNSKAGKSELVRTLMTMMIGANPPMMPGSQCTEVQIDTFRTGTKGVPIFIDDVNGWRYQKYVTSAVKNDDFGKNQGLDNYPAVIVSANEASSGNGVSNIAHEVSRRAVICRPQASMTLAQMMRNNVVKEIQNSVGTGLYREYLRRMLEIVPKMIEDMEEKRVETSPDILEASSEVLMEIFSEYYGKKLPDYIRKLSIDNYFNERVLSSYVIRLISRDWRNDPSMFALSERTNELKWNVAEKDESEQETILRELPENLEVYKSGTLIVMKLDAARDFFGLPFKRTLWERIMRK